MKLGYPARVSTHDGVRGKRRSGMQRLIDFLTFPLRAILPFNGASRWGLSSRATERFDYAAREVIGYCLDVGCGKYNYFVNEYLGGHGKGIDVYAYEGLTQDHLVQDMTRFPFEDGSFDSVTLIASINHIPRPHRDAELAEAYRCLRPGGNIIVTMGNPLAEILVHKVVWLHGKLLNAGYDMDTQRGMVEEEAYYLKDEEILERLSRAGFKDIRKKYFLSQWGLNHLFVGWKGAESQPARPQLEQMASVTGESRKPETEHERVLSSAASRVDSRGEPGAAAADDA